MEIILVGDDYEKVDYVDRARRKGPAIGDSVAVRETQHAIATVAKSGKPRRTKWLMDTGCGHDLIGLRGNDLHDGKWGHRGWSES